MTKFHTKINRDHIGLIIFYSPFLEKTFFQREVYFSFRAQSGVTEISYAYLYFMNIISGISIGFLGYTMFVILDTIIKKYLVNDYSVFQINFYICLFVTSAHL